MRRLFCRGAKFTVGAIEEATGLETLGSLVAGVLGANVIFLLAGALDEAKWFWWISTQAHAEVSLLGRGLVVVGVHFAV